MIYLVSGKVGSGKSHAIRKIIEMLGWKRCSGLLAMEILEDGQRVGYSTLGLHSRKQIVLAHKLFDKRFQIEDFGVDILSFDQLCQREFEDLDAAFMIIDEIGRMQCLSYRFREYLDGLLESGKTLIASICYDDDVEYIRELKKRDGVRLIELDENNRDELPLQIVKEVTRYDEVYQDKLKLAELYQSEPERYTYEGDKILLRSTHDLRTITKEDGIYHCTCYYYKENGVCSHILSLLLNK